MILCRPTQISESPLLFRGRKGEKETSFFVFWCFFLVDHGRSIWHFDSSSPKKGGGGAVFFVSFVFCWPVFFFFRVVMYIYIYQILSVFLMFLFFRVGAIFFLVGGGGGFLAQLAATNQKLSKTIHIKVDMKPTTTSKASVCYPQVHVLCQGASQMLDSII